MPDLWEALKFALGNVQRGGQQSREFLEGNPDPSVMMGDPSVGMGSAALPFALKRVAGYGVGEARVYDAFIHELAGRQHQSPFARLRVGPALGNDLEASVTPMGLGQITADRSSALPRPEANSEMIRSALKLIATIFPNAERVGGWRTTGMGVGHSFGGSKGIDLAKIRASMSEEAKQKLLSDILDGIAK